MQSFDNDSSNKSMTLSSKPLSTQSSGYRENDTNFLAFKGWNRPRIAQEYLVGEGLQNKNNQGPRLNQESGMSRYSKRKANKFNVFDSFGARGKGEFDFRYGLNAPAGMTGYNSKEKMAVITKGGVSSCTPGYKMEGGECVAIEQDIICQPGWVKRGGKCFKGGREFEFGVQADNRPNLTRREDGITLKEMRSYVQENYSGQTLNVDKSGPTYHIVLILMVIIGFLAVYSKTRR